MPVLQAALDDELYHAAQVYAVTNRTTMKQLVTEALAKRIGHPVPEQPKRGAPKKDKP